MGSLTPNHCPVPRLNEAVTRPEPAPIPSQARRSLARHWPGGMLYRWTHQRNCVVFVLHVFGCSGSLVLCRLSSGCRELGLLSGCGASHCSLLLCGAQALGHLGFSSCCSQAPEHQFSCCGVWAQSPQGTWNLPRPGIECVSPALAGRFIATEPPEKPQRNFKK